MSERALQRYFISEVKKRALGIIVKVDCPSRRGWPDLIHAFPGGELRLIELKTDMGKLSMHQLMLHKELKDIGHSVTVLSGKDEIETYLREIEYYANA